MRASLAHTTTMGLLLAFSLNGPGCLFDHGSDARVWMSIAPIQCGGNAWEIEDASIRDYLADRGARVYDLKESTFAEAVCLACTCFTGVRVDVLVDENDVDILAAEGFYPYEDWPY